MKTHLFAICLFVQTAIASPGADLAGDEPGLAYPEKADFVRVNTWSFLDDARTISCAGQTLSVISTAKTRLDELKEPGLPNEGIEARILGVGYMERHEKSSVKAADRLTSHGDAFPVKKAKLTPFPPTSPDGVRSLKIRELP